DVCSSDLAERRHFDAHALARLDEQRPRGSRELLAVDSKRYVSHMCRAKVVAPASRRPSRGRPALAFISKSETCGNSPATPAGETPAATRGREVAPPRLLSRTGTAGLPGDLQTLCGTSSQTRSLASPPHPRADRTSVQACSPPSTGCCRCLFSYRRLRENALMSSWSSPFPLGTGCTTRNFRAGKTSWCAGRISRCTAGRQSPPRRLNPAWTRPSRRNQNPWQRQLQLR